jgi:hypothetical protein
MIHSAELRETELGRPWLRGQEAEQAKRFVALWDRTVTPKTTNYLQGTLYRLNMADLYKQYEKLHRKTRSRDGRKAKSISASVMFGWLYRTTSRDEDL